jgi:hemolysin activation/secretion protein
LPIWGSDNGRDIGIELSNPYGSTAFFSARLTAAHQQRLGVNSPWQINLKAEGQVSGTPLPSSEQLGYGGPNFGRAFHSTYTLGDQGLLGSVELAYTFPPQKGFVLQPYLFLDGGTTSLKEAAPGFPLTQSVSGYGVGLRANALAANWLSFDLGWGIPASNTVEPSRIGAGESIVFFKANVNF